MVPVPFLSEWHASSKFDWHFPFPKSRYEGHGIQFLVLTVLGKIFQAPLDQVFDVLDLVIVTISPLDFDVRCQMSVSASVSAEL